MKCSLWLTCRDKQKGPRHRCDQFRILKQVGDVSEFGFLEMIPRGETVDDPDEEDPLTPKTRKSTGSSSRVEELAQGGHRKAKRLLQELDANQRDLPDFDVEDPGGNFILTAMRDAYDADTNTIRDLKVDDRDLKRAHNYWDFCTTVSGKSLKPPFARQLWVAALLLGEYCPRCTRTKWVDDIQNIPVDMDPADLARKMVLLKAGRCPKCGAHKSELILGDEMVGYNQLVMCVGQRGGKSAFNSTLAANHLHVLLKAPRLSSICRGIQDFTPLTFTFVGLTAGRAIRLLWNPFVEIIKANDWFKSYFSMMDSYGKDHGVEYYKSNVLFMRFLHKNIDVYPMGPVKRSLRGDTRVLAAVDELGWFPLSKNAVDDDSPDEEDDAREHANADEVFASLDNSLMTMRTEVYDLYRRGIDNVPTGLMLNLSSPQSQRDKIMRLLKESGDPEALSLGVQLPTWEISPLYTKDHPVIRAAYRKNAIKAERDFGANPPALNSSMFPDATLEPLYAEERKNTHSIKTISTRGEDDEDQDDTVIHRTRAELIEVSLPQEFPPSIIALDAGLTGNSFAINVAYPSGTTLKVLTLLEIIPRRGTQIDFPAMYQNVIKPLIKLMNAKALAADRWNSITTLQTAKDDFPDLVCMQVSLKARDFSAFIASTNDGEIEYPTLEVPIAEIKDVTNYRKQLQGMPSAHTFLQYLTTKLVNGTLTKGDGYTDDILRSVMVSHAMAFNPKIQEHLAKFRHIGTGAKAGVTNSAVFTASRGRYPGT
jgi:hypothetical protein